MIDQRTSSPPPEWEALARYQAGESPADEARQVAAWLAAHPHDAALLAALDEAVVQALASARADASAADVDVEAALRAVKARRDATSPRRAPGVLPLRPPAEAVRVRRRRVTWLAAGGLAAAAALALVLRGEADVGAPDTTATGATVDGGLRLVLPGRTMETAVGVRDSLRLPDGTRVVLAPGSRLAVSPAFGDGGREVTLAGQAHFTATHDAARPFTVRANGALVRDLGTVFTVRTDGVGATGGIAVVVTEGRVALDARGGSAVVLDAGDRAERDAAGAVRVERGVAGADDVAWATSGARVYRAAPVALVAADLARWHGVTLRVDDARLASRRLTATFTDESLDEVLRVIALALGATVDRDGGTAVLRPADGAVR